MKTSPYVKKKYFLNKSFRVSRNIWRKMQLLYIGSTIKNLRGKNKKFIGMNKKCFGKIKKILDSKTKISNWEKNFKRSSLIKKKKKHRQKHSLNLKLPNRSILIQLKLSSIKIFHKLMKFFLQENLNLIMMIVYNSINNKSQSTNWSIISSSSKEVSGKETPI